MTRPEKFLSPSSCNFRACDQQCFRFGYSGGTCVNGRCKCNRFLNAEDAVAENALSNLEDNESDNFFETEDASDSQFPIRICRLSKCRRKCNRRGYELAKCVDGRCKCYKKTHTKDTMNDLEESVSLEDNFLGTKDAVDEYSEFAQRRICRLPKCNRTCTRRGYEVAKCIYGRCKCFNKTQAQDEISETSLSVFDMSEDQTERGCIKWVCDILCRRLKFPSGACVNDRCQCNKFSRTEEEPSPRNDVTRDQNEESNVILRTYEDAVAEDTVSNFEDNESDNLFETEDASDSQFPIRICRLSKCRRKCNRRGYELAKCVDGRCKCYKKTKDASPLNDVTSDENE